MTRSRQLVTEEPLIYVLDYTISSTKSTTVSWLPLMLCVWNIEIITSTTIAPRPCSARVGHPFRSRLTHTPLSLLIPMSSRLPFLPPGSQSDDQKSFYHDLSSIIEKYFGDK